MIRVLDEEKINRIIDALLALQEQEDVTIPALWRQLIETEKGIGNLVPAGAGFGFFYFSQRAYGFARCVFSLYIKRKRAPNGRRAVRSLVPSGKGGCGGV